MEQFDAVGKAIDDFVTEHNYRLDSVLYNGGTVVALAATLGATAFSWTDSNAWVPRALTALAAFIIGIERALSFGERWRFHRRMCGLGQSLRVRLDLARPLGGSDLRDELRAIADELMALRRDGDVPIGVKPPT